MSLLSLSQVGKRFGADVILSDVSFRVESGDHVALVGANGAGKSTLLRIIAGLDEPDTGTVARARGTTIAYLPQEPELNAPYTLYESLLDVFRDALAAQERLRTLEHDMAGAHASPETIEEYGRLQALVEHTGYDYRSRVERVLLGLGFPEDSWYTRVSTLSGGQRTRINLGRTLLRDADLLLLDEPTNHLDIPALEWLESYLTDLKRAFIIVAHDRYLLDRVTRRTLELSFEHVTAYDAPYSGYLELKSERMERQRLDFEAQQRHIAKTEDFIRRYGAGQRSKEARGRQKRLDRLERFERPREEATLSLTVRKSARSGDLALEVRDLVAGYEGKPLVRLPDDVIVRRGDKIALIGPNGAGKTTLLRTLIGELPPIVGRARWGARTSVGYYSQTLSRLDPNRSVLEEIQAVKPMGEEEARTYLGRFVFSGDDVYKPVRVLSGGERSRVALARLLLEHPNVLVLDEPTNHLDITSRDALRDVLGDFDGTLLFVSHDRYLIGALARELWVVEDGTLARFAGTYGEYVSGSARALDAGRKRVSTVDRGETPEQLVRELEREAEELAGRLAEAGPTIPVSQLVELTEQYSQLIKELQEGQRAWVESVKDELHASSESRVRSAAAKRR